METVQRFTASDGIQLAYRLHKRGESGTALVMVHGLASNMTRWTELVETMQLKPDWDLLQIDLRGHGSSAYRGEITHEIWANDLHDLLLDEGYEKVIILGHSLGAQVAITFADLYPHFSAGLILIDPIFPDCLEGRLATVARNRLGFWVLVRLMWLINALGIKRRKFPKLDLRELDRQTRDLLSKHTDTDISQYYARPTSDMKNLPLANYLQDLYEVTRPLPPLSLIEVSVLVLLSKGVSLSNFDSTQQHIAEIPNAETVIIDADHWLLTEKPEEARAAIEAWCAKQA